MKKKMKIILFGLVLGILGVVLFSFSSDSDFLNTRNYYYYSLCDKPILYKIGTIDSRFGLTNSEVITATNKSANIWNTATKKQLFIYDPLATLTINMVFDRRQSLNTQITQLENDLNTGKTTLDKEIEKFEEQSALFDQQNASFKEKVEKWNTQGGASQEEFDSLTSEQQSLNNEAQKLNLMAKKLNISAGQYNNQISELNQTIGSFNKALQIRPEEGIYNPQENRIDIFFNNNQDELIRTITHELGHARGLSHSTNPLAIMYPTTTDNLTPIKDEINKLQEICQIRPFYKPLIENFLLNIDYTISKLNQ